MSYRARFTVEKKGKFLDHLRAIPNVTRAARLVGVSRRTVYDAKSADPDFAAQWEDAIDEGIEALEAEAMRRAAEGTDKPVFYQGMEVAVLKEYSDTLMIFLLKAHRPEKYRDNIDFTTKGEPINEIKIVEVRLSPAPLDESLPD